MPDFQNFEYYPGFAKFLVFSGESYGVRSTLRNPHVRSILEAIDKSKNPSASLKLAMLEPIFVEFADECLKIVEPVADTEGF